MVKSRSIRILILAVALMLVAALGTAGSSGTDELRFRVLLDDKEIGYHNFRVTERGDEQVIESEASFDVRLLFVPVYSYRHSNTEVWRDGCLRRIESRTDDNGEPFEVRGIPQQQGLKVATREEADLLAGCVRSFAYWNRGFVGEDRLLNAQNGEYMPVEVRTLGRDTLRMGEREVIAEAYRILAPEKNVDITVWYDQQSGRWLALESVAKNGSLVRYLPEHVDDVVIASRVTPTDS
ncbi:MAG: DUF6134 family protein [Chromatiales bacterium]|jgi:hypothetical protein